MTGTVESKMPTDADQHDVLGGAGQRRVGDQGRVGVRIGDASSQAAAGVRARDEEDAPSDVVVHQPELALSTRSGSRIRCR